MASERLHLMPRGMGPPTAEVWRVNCLRENLFVGAGGGGDLI